MNELLKYIKYSNSDIKSKTNTYYFILFIYFLFYRTNITKKGYLSYQEDPLVDKWTKRWCVIRR